MVQAVIQLCWSAHQPCGALAQSLPHNSRLQGLETHVVQGDPEGQELCLIGAQQVIVSLCRQKGGRSEWTLMLKGR